MEINALEIVARYLESHDYDCLFNYQYECICMVDNIREDMLTCDGITSDCIAGHWHLCDCNEDCLCHVSPQESQGECND